MWALSFSKSRDLANHGFQLLFQLRHVLFLQSQVVARPRLIGAHQFGGAGWVLEVSANRNLNLFAAVHQPQHDE